MVMKDKLYIGIDPGKSGGIAALTATGKVLWDMKLSETPQDIFKFLYGATSFHDVRVLVEKVWIRAGQQGQSKFIEGFGILHGMLIALSVVDRVTSFEFVAPQTWMKKMGCLTKGDKNISKAAAQALWPKHGVHHWNSDSLLICEYLRRQHEKAS